MAAPKVEKLDSVVASLNPIYQSSVNNINAQKNLVPTKYDAQRSALEAAKVQGFDQINNQATGRGGSFSGVPVNEQSKYLSTTFLPGMQQADFQQNADVLALDQALAQLDLQRGQQAVGIRDNQQSALNQYLLQQSQQQFTAQQNALDRAASAKLAAARSSGGGGSGGSASNSGYFTKTSQTGGTNFYDYNGNPVTAAQYFASQGGSVGDLINFLSRDADKTSQAALKAYQANPAAAKQKYSYIFGGI